MAKVYGHRRCFTHQKLFTTGNKCKMPEASIISHFYSFHWQRQCGDHFCLLCHRITGKQRQCDGGTPMANVSHTPSPTQKNTRTNKCLGRWVISACSWDSALHRLVLVFSPLHCSVGQSWRLLLPPSSHSAALPSAWFAWVWQSFFLLGSVRSAEWGSPVHPCWQLPLWSCQSCHSTCWLSAGQLIWP